MEVSKKKKYEIDMTTGPILPKMLLFAIPLMFSSILQLLFNAADIIVIGRFSGDTALAAVGSNTSLIGLLTNLFIGLSVGANVVAAKYYGSQNDEDLSETVQTSIYMSLVSGVVMTIIGVAMARVILEWMQTPDEVLPLATLYLVIYFFGMTPVMIYNFGSALLRAVGDTRRPLYYLIFAGIVNVVLNLWFVIGLGLGVAGVALATVISQVISAMLVIRCLARESGGIRIDMHHLHFHWSKFFKILQIGLPAGVQGMLFSISNVVIQSAVNTFGAVVMAGNTAAANIELFVYFAMNSFYQAIISFTAQNYGAGKRERVYRVLMIGIYCSTAVGAVLGNLAVLFGHSLLGIYSTSAAVIDAGITRMRIVACPYFICGIMDDMVGSMRGLGYSVVPMVVSLFGACVLRLIWIAVIFKFPMLKNVTMVYMSYPVTWIITLAIHVLCFNFIARRLGIRRVPLIGRAPLKFMRKIRGASRS